MCKQYLALKAFLLRVLVIGTGRQVKKLIGSRRRFMVPT